MSSAKLSFISALAAAALVSLGAFWLRRERTAEAHALRQANAALQREAFLQQQSAAAPAATQTLPGQGRSESPTTSAPPTDDEGTDYRFQGQATPVDTLQTMAWAMDRGDVEFVLKVITFDDAARTKVEAYRASLPPEARARWPNVELLAATLLTNRGINRPYPRADLLARATVEPVTDERVVLRLPGTPKDREVYQKVGDEWKWVITEALVDAYLAQVSRAARP